MPQAAPRRWSSKTHNVKIEHKIGARAAGKAGVNLELDH